MSAAVIEAINSGLEVVGIYDGYQHLIDRRTDMVRRLEISDVSKIHNLGGSILRTARANPTRDPEHLSNAVTTLKQLNISYLVTIGGDDTAFGASEIARASEGDIRVSHIPKTIDNDLPLPGNIPTFGFETARHVGSELIRNLIEDSRTTNRWYFAVVMGRKAGHLALGMGKSASATITIIPEEFPQEVITIEQVSRVLEAAIYKRRATGNQHGLAVIAEGVAEKMDPEALAQMPGVEVRRDQYGHIRLDEIPLEKLLKREVQARFQERGEQITIVDHTIGYELRSASPIPFDIDYTRTLGYAAVRLLLSDIKEGEKYEGGMVYLQDGRSGAMPFSELRDPDTGRTRVRMVDMEGEYYHVAREYMIRLERSDIEDEQALAKISASAGMKPKQFKERYASVVNVS